MKHTKGPWVFGPDIDALLAGDAIVSQVIQSASSEFTMQPHVANVGGLNQSNEEIEANARLIAAAPEMLDLLKSVYAAVYRDDERGTDSIARTLGPQLQALIARIEGDNK